MPDFYPVIMVRQEWVLEPEEMGSKEKVWYRKPDDKTPWLFKFPKQNTGEHWAEKVAAEIAALLGMQHARVELAEFGNGQGSTTESFIRDGMELIHGNQVLAGIVQGYNPEMRFRQSDHTLANIMRAMEQIFPDPLASNRAKARLAEYLVLDALIGNTDRHHENWGILRERIAGLTLVAPSFDHASSLGRELLDERRERWLAQQDVGKYAEKGRGGIFWSEDQPRGPSPLELVRLAYGAYPGFFTPAVKKLEKIDEVSIERIIQRVPADWMTSPSRAFAMTLICYNLEQLLELYR